LYHRRYGIPDCQLIVFDNFHEIDGRVPRVFFLGRDANERSPLGKKWPDHLRGKRAVFLLVRDPRDVGVSLYFHLLDRASEKERWRKGIFSRDEVAGKTMFEFVRDEQFGVPRIIRCLNDWQRAIANEPNASIVRYEDLRVQPEATLRRMTNLSGEDFTDEEVSAAVEFASFDSLRTKEQQGFFDSDRLRCPNESKHTASKVRRGKVGGFQDYFGEECIEELNSMVTSELSPEFGYT
jgi:hypothetical protein